MRRRFPDLMRRAGSRWRTGGVESTPFHPSQIAAVKHFWESDSGVLEATADPAEDTDTVEFWQPTIGSLDLVQSTAGARPQYLTAGGPNGKPQLVFGIGDYMDDAGPGSISATPFHVFLVISQPSTWVNCFLFDSDGPAGTRAAVWHDSGVMNQFQSTNGATLAAPATATWLLLEACFLGSASSYMRFGAGAAATGNCGNTGWAGFRLGGNRALTRTLNGNVAAFMIADAQISGTNLTNLRTWFNTEYGVTV